MSNTRWKSSDCSEGGILEVQGKLFLRLKCVKRCSAYEEKPEACPVERKFNVAALTPESPNDAGSAKSISCFNDALFNYGDMHDFEGLCSRYELKKITLDDGKSYYRSTPSMWMKLLTGDPKLLFAIQAHIDGSWSRQHRLIFSALNAEQWLTLLIGDPEFYFEYRRKEENESRPELGSAAWLNICLRHPGLYSQVVADGVCAFSDLELAWLLAEYPDLDDAAYGRLKECSHDGQVWTRLLLGGVDVAREKFWKDCDYFSLDGDQWLMLLNASEPIRNEAIKQLNARHLSRRFSDRNWHEVLSKPWGAKIVDRPRVWNFTQFFGAAPKEAAKAQFFSMIGISLLLSLAGVVFGIMISGCTTTYMAVLLIVAAVWALTATACFSSKAVANNYVMVLNGVLVGLIVGVLPHLALLLASITRIGLDAVSGLVVVALLLLAVFGVITVLRKLKLWLFYGIIALVGIGYLYLLVATPSWDVFMKSKGMAKLERFYRDRFLKKDSYWTKWELACKKGSAAELRALIAKWKPSSDPKDGVADRYRTAMTQLADAMLDKNFPESQRLELAKFFRENFKKDPDTTVEKHIRNKIAEAKNSGSREDFERCWKIAQECGFDPDSDPALMAAAQDLVGTMEDLESIRQVWAVMTPEGKKRVGEAASTKVAANFGKFVNTPEDVAVLEKIAGNCDFGEEFWQNLLDYLTKRRDGKLFRRACDIVPYAYNGLKNDSKKKFEREVVEEEIKILTAFADDPDDEEQKKNFLTIGNLDDHATYRDDFFFWSGYAKGNDVGEWKKCIDAFLQACGCSSSDDSRKFALKRKTARMARECCHIFAAKLAEGDESDRRSALALWKYWIGNNSNGDREKLSTAYRGILTLLEGGSDEFRKYFFEASGSAAIDADGFKDFLKEKALALNDKFDESQSQALLKLFGSFEEIPQELKDRMNR